MWQHVQQTSLFEQFVVGIERIDQPRLCDTVHMSGHETQKGILLSSLEGRQLWDQNIQNFCGTPTALHKKIVSRPGLTWALYFCCSFYVVSTPVATATIESPIESTSVATSTLTQQDEFSISATNWRLYGCKPCSRRVYVQNSAVVLCIYLQKKKNTKVRGFFEVRHDTRRVSVYCCFSVVLMLFWWILSSYSVSHKSPRLVSTFAACAHSLAECSMKKIIFPSLRHCFLKQCGSQVHLRLIFTLHRITVMLW